MDAKLDPLFQDAVDSQALPGVAACVINVSGEKLYHKAFGPNDVSRPDSKYSTSTPTVLFSMTKLVTCVAALQLVEKGKLSLSDLVEKYVPEIAHIQVMDGKDSDGKIKLRPAKTKPTILNLMTHTAGFTYDFFSHDQLAWRIDVGQTPSAYKDGLMETYRAPLAHDAGERYTYGINIDWLGFCIEAVTGMDLEKYLEQHILKPLGMNRTGGDFADGVEPLIVHMSGEDGKLTPIPQFAPPSNPEKHAGGGFLTSTLDDYSEFLLTLLNKGTHPKTHVKILESKTVEDYLFQDLLPQVCSSEGVGEFHVASMPVTNTGRFMPGTKLGWSAGVLVNNEDTGYGRKAGSGAWAGLGNLYFWMDPKTGLLGLIMTNLFPFFHREVLFLFDAMEKAAYRTLQEVSKHKDGGTGSNYHVW